jgi:hypothetical protein
MVEAQQAAEAVSTLDRTLGVRSDLEHPITVWLVKDLLLMAVCPAGDQYSEELPGQGGSCARSPVDEDRLPERT